MPLRRTEDLLISVLGVSPAHHEKLIQIRGMQQEGLFVGYHARSAIAEAAAGLNASTERVHSHPALE